MFKMVSGQEQDGALQSGPQFLSQLSNSSMGSPQIFIESMPGIPHMETKSTGGATDIKQNGPEFKSDLSNPSSGSLQDSSASVHFPESVRDIQISYTDLVYDETKPLGRGAYGQVFLGTFRREPVAIKIYDFRGVLSEKDRKAILHEAKAMDKLRSKYLVGFRGIFLEPSYGLVMEYCDGGTLTQRLAKSEIRIDYAQQLLWGKQISYGLHALHSINIFHRDLKSDNVLLNTFGEAKIADFGLSQIKSSASTQSRQGSQSAAGTIPWMAPELFEGNPHSAAADIYSLGTVLWEIVARGIPFSGKMAVVIIGMVLAGRRETLPENCPKIFERLILACWQANPKQRPTAAQIGDQLDAELKLLPDAPSDSREIKLGRVSEHQESKYESDLKETSSEADFQEGLSHYKIYQYAQALPFFEKSGQRGYPLAHLYLGIMYKNSGYSVVKDDAKSQSYFKKVSESTAWFKERMETADPELQYFLGQFYEWVEKDEKQYVAYYQKAVAQGHAAANNRLGECYRYGKGVTKDAKQAVEHYQKAAEKGNADAESNLGSCYQYGVGVIKDEKQAGAYYQKAADQGHPHAQNWLGWFYQNGIGVTKDAKEAIKYYQKAAKQGESYAQNNLGVCYKNGEGVAQDEKLAISFYQRAADQGNSLAQYNLGCCYENGVGVVKDEKQAAVYYQKAADQKYLAAQYVIGQCYKDGKGVDKDEKLAVKYFQEAADIGDLASQYTLGQCYESGIGVQKDEKLAVEYYQKAAKENYALAQINLGICYQNGRGIAKNQKEAVNYFRKAADQGNSVALSNLGWCYEYGSGIAKDENQASIYYKKAADAGNAASQNSIGWRYQNGIGISKDVKQAVYYFRKGAENGNSAAQTNLGWCYEKGIGVEPNWTWAVYYYHLAAEQGNASGQNLLGVCYHNGIGVEKNINTAIYWYKLAQEQGNSDARSNLFKLGVIIPLSRNSNATFGTVVRQHVEDAFRPLGANPTNNNCLIM